MRKIYLAVLVDGQRVIADDGTVTRRPRAEEELAILRELVGSAVGLDETRGDVLTLKSLTFEPIAEDGHIGRGKPVGRLCADQRDDGDSNCRFGDCGARAWPVRHSPDADGQARVVPQLAAATAPLALPGVPAPARRRVLNGEIDDGTDLPPFSMGAAQQHDRMPTDPVARLRRLIEERQVESVEILRGWMEHEEEKA